MGKFTLDLSTDTPESIESGSNLPVGWYLVNLADVYNDEKNAGMTKFKYVVSIGPYKGKQTIDSTGDPSQATEEAAPFIARRQKLLAKRLGLITGTEAGCVDIDFADAVGKDFLIEVGPHSYTSKKTNKLVETTQIKFDGIYPVDYPLDKFPKGFPANDFRDYLEGPATSSGAAQNGGGAAPAQAGGGNGKDAAGASKRQYSAKDL